MSWLKHGRGRGNFHTWTWRKVLWWWPYFLKFSIQLGPYFMPELDLIDPNFWGEKIGLIRSHLVSEIIGPTFGLNLLAKLTKKIFDSFELFCINVLLGFRSNWPTFSNHCIFWSTPFGKRWWNWVSLFTMC